MAGILGTSVITVLIGLSKTKWENAQQSEWIKLTVNSTNIIFIIRRAKIQQKFRSTVRRNPFVKRAAIQLKAMC